MSKIIEVKNISYSYKHHGKTSPPVLKDISLTIEKGEFVSIIGENGSGKSTLGKMFNALLIPDEGSVHIGEYDTKEKKNFINIRKKCGMVFQNPDNALVSSIVADDIAFGPENIGLPNEEIVKRVDKTLEIISMTEYKEVDPNRLSGGQKQRVAIAGVLAMNPEIIVFDEATSMLDPNGKEEIIDLISDLHKKGTTVINITHNMEEVLCSERVFVIKDGRLMSANTPEKTFSDDELVRVCNLDLPFEYKVERALCSK